MKKLLITLLIILLNTSISFGIEDNQLESIEFQDANYNIENLTIDENNPDIVETKEKTLVEKLNDVYHLEVERIDKPTYLLNEILTKHFNEDSALESIQLWGAYNGNLGLEFINNQDSMRGNYQFNAINAGIDGVFKNNNADFRIMFGVSPLSSRNVVQNLFADMYVATNKIPHHRIKIGHFRPAAGVEGSGSSYTLPLINRSQISRTFGTVRKLGANVTGDYSLVDYNLGLYSSDTYFHEFFPGAEFAGWITLKPLGLTNGKYGNLRIGGGLQGGHREENYCVTGAYVGYEYKKFMANFEWANANGYNGPQDMSTNTHATGFYTTLGYRITPKLQLLARYDQFNPNESAKNNTSREYSTGLNYYIKGQGLKIMLNYVFCQNEATRDSHKILFGTQILL